MANLYLTPAEKYTAALGGFYYGDLPEPGTVYTQLIKDILDGSTPDKEPKNILARFIYSLYISDLGDPYPRYELAKLLYWKLHNITPTKSGSVLTVTIDGKEDYMTINTDLSRLWYKVLFGSKTDIITEFPYIFNTMQNKLSDWELFGNTVQSTTPTPENPVIPQGTGERTRNLAPPLTEWIDGYVSASGAIAPPSENYKEKSSDYIPVKAGIECTFSVGNEFPGGPYYPWRAIGWYTQDKTFISRASGNAGGALSTSAPSNAVYCRLSYRAHGETTNPMFNLGSTPLPYEPYGYKIPISSANTTTPVYLGEVETTRKIKKVVLTGEETITFASEDDNRMVGFFTIPGMGMKSSETGYCNILQWKSSYSQSEYNRIVSNGSTRFYMSIAKSALPEPTFDGFVSYLRQQYANGTPVTVWYVLAEPETGIVNEPLMKIGDYVDSMSRAQTGIDIPTVIGQNTLDVLTTVEPSSMSIEYTSADENRSRSKRISLLKSPLKKRLIK